MNELRLVIWQRGATTAELFTYALIVIVLASTVFGLYRNYQLDSAIADALIQGEEEKILIEEYYQAEGQMPQSEADFGLEDFTPVGILKDISWRPGVFGETGSDELRMGTLNGIVDLSEFGASFEDYESGFWLIARAQEDGTIVWDCMADPVTTDALPGKYLPDSCERASDSED